MHTDDLLNRLLIRPCEQHDHLIVVSGYVSGSMSLRHALGNKETKVPGIRDDLQVDVVYGMYQAEGVLRADHQAFLAVNRNRPLYNVHYYVGSRPLHAKVYVWLKNGDPKTAFVGSANYSVASMYGRILEAVTEVEPVAAYDFAVQALTSSALADSFDPPKYRSRYLPPAADIEERQESFDEVKTNLPSVRLPLWAVREGRIHERSGLNWGQRPGREPNQAYVPVPAEVAQGGFFPGRGDYFTILTDDGESFDCVVAQDNSKAIETPLNNSTLGTYFRNRLGVALGQFVTLDDLDRYGRRDVTIYRASEDKYLLDFRPDE